MTSVPPAGSLRYSNLDKGNLIFARIIWKISEGFDSIYFLDDDGKKWSINEAKELLDYLTVWPCSQEIRVNGFDHLPELCIRGTRPNEITYYDVLAQIDIFLNLESSKSVRDSARFFRGLYYEYAEDSNNRPIFKAVFDKRPL